MVSTADSGIDLITSVGQHLLLINVLLPPPFRRRRETYPRVISEPLGNQPEPVLTKPDKVESEGTAPLNGADPTTSLEQLNFIGGRKLVMDQHHIAHAMGSGK